MSFTDVTMNQSSSVGLSFDLGVLCPIFEINAISETNEIIESEGYLVLGAVVNPEIGLRCFEKGFYVRRGADTIQLAPPFISSKEQVDSLINAVGESLHELG